VNLVPDQGSGERSHGSRRPEVPQTLQGNLEGRGSGPTREGGNTGETEECTNRRRPDARKVGGGAVAAATRYTSARGDSSDAEQIRVSARTDAVPGWWPTNRRSQAGRCSWETGWIEVRSRFEAMSDEAGGPMNVRSPRGRRTRTGRGQDP